MRAVATGFSTVDDALGGLITGDNVVWLCDDPALYGTLVAGFTDGALTARADRCLYVDFGLGLLDDHRQVERIDAGVRSVYRSPAALADALERQVRESTPTCLVIDPLARAGRGWSTDTAKRFFERICPAMLQAGVTAYWAIDASLGRAFIDHVRQVTQCLLDVRGGRLRVLKAEGRPESLLGISYKLTVGADGVIATSAPAGGRLARGLAAVRSQLGLTQHELASIGNVTPSAISQAEAGTRGLSLDTVITIADRLEMPVDRLLGGSPPRGYRLARHDRSRKLPDSNVTALAGDSTVGLRAYLVELTGSDWVEPPIDHRGVSALTVHRGLVQVDVADDRPVLRAGDCLLIDDATVRGWRRLRAEPASCFWILRD